LPSKSYEASSAGEMLRYAGNHLLFLAAPLLMGALPARAELTVRLNASEGAPGFTFRFQAFDCTGKRAEVIWRLKVTNHNLIYMVEDRLLLHGFDAVNGTFTAPSHEKFRYLVVEAVAKPKAEKLDKSKPGSGREVLTRMVDAYRKASSYADAGTVHLLAYRDAEGYPQWMELTPATAALLLGAQAASIGQAAMDLGLADLSEALELLARFQANGAIAGFTPDLPLPGSPAPSAA